MLAANRSLSLSTDRIHVPKTSEIVADQIRAQIIRGELTEGDTLPPEGHLIDNLGISRPTLREAIRILEAEGLISVVRGSRTGAKVHKPSVDLVSRYAGYVLESQGTTISELYNSRLGVEPTVVRWLATDRGAAPGMADLKAVLADLHDLMRQGSYHEFMDLGQVFHYALVAAADNNVLTFLNRILLNLARKHQIEFQERHPRKEADRAKVVRTGYKSLEKLVRLIEEGAVEEAVEHWRLHLRNVHEMWTAKGEGDRIVNSLKRDG